MSSPETDSSSSFDTQDSTADSSSPMTLKKAIISVVVLVVILGSPWWLTAIPGFSN